MKMANAMASTAKVMGSMNAQMNPEQMAQTMQQFERENARMEMTDELSKSCCCCRSVIIL